MMIKNSLKICIILCGYQLRIRIECNMGVREIYLCGEGNHGIQLYCGHLWVFVGRDILHVYLFVGNYEQLHRIQTSKHLSVYVWPGVAEMRHAHCH